MTVKYYSLPASSCTYCRGTEILLRRRGIEVEKYRLDEDPEAMEYVKSLGYSSAPVIVVERDGEVIDHWGGAPSDVRITALAKQLAAA